MLDISIGEIQRNTAILSNLTEPLAVFNRRKNKQVATIYPVESESKKNMIESLAGSFRSETSVHLNDEELDEAIRKATEERILERHQRFSQQYGIDKNKVILKLKEILIMPGIVGDKHISIKALDIMQSHNVNYIDALICAKNALQGFDKISFDKKVIKC